MDKRLAFHYLENVFPDGDGKCNKPEAETKRWFPVVACVAEDGAWAAAWIGDRDLFVYRVRGASFPIPDEIERKFRIVVSKILSIHCLETRQCCQRI